MSNYPLAEVIKDKLKEQDKRLNWFLGEIDKSERWFYGLKTVDDLQLKLINQISEILGFDIIKDLYKWNGKELEAKSANVVNEPAPKYDKAQEITVQLSLKGTSSALSKNLNKVVEALIKESEKSGIRIG